MLKQVHISVLMAVYNTDFAATKRAIDSVLNQDYQDFELPMDEFPLLVVKILAYCGISIREQDIVQIAKAQEIQDIQQNQ